MENACLDTKEGKKKEKENSGMFICPCHKSVEEVSFTFLLKENTIFIIIGLSLKFEAISLKIWK